MFIHDGKPRGKTLVYGKARRSTPAYNPFEKDDTIVVKTQSSSSSRQDENESEQPQIRRQVVKSIEASPTKKLNDLPRRTLSDQKPVCRGLNSRKVSGLVNGTKQSPSTFDFPSSAEEDSTVIYQESMQKRRRLTPVRNGGTIVKPDPYEPSRSNGKEDITEDSQHLRTRQRQSLYLEQRSSPRERPERPPLEDMTV